MSTIRRERESESGGSGYTFLKPMPTVHPVKAGILTAVEPVGEEAALLFPSPSGPDPGSPVGIALGPYRIEERIGRGGMGAVFRAIDIRLDRIVALKVLSPELSRDRSAVQRFQNGARAAAKLDHENIAQVHDVGHDQSLYYIAFEFVAGTNLRDVLHEHGGAFTPADAVNVTLQIADALRHTAAADVVHRDIKPSNIIITPAGRAKLVDWGLARQNSQELSQELTQTGTTLGTFDYIAPEQAVDPRNVDVRSDIYSLGCTLYHMLTGEPPYPRGSMFQKVVDHHRAAALDPSARNPQVSAELSRIVRKMMASDPAQRYITPQEVIYDLTTLAPTLGLESYAGPGRAWVAARDPSNLAPAGWGWLGAFVGLILLVWYLDRPGRWAGPETPLISLEHPHKGEASAASSGDTIASNASRATTSTTAPDAPAETGSRKRGPRHGIRSGMPSTMRDIFANEPGAGRVIAGTDATTPPSALANTTTPATASTGSGATQPAAAMSDRYVVRPSTGGEPKRFASLELACTNAADNDIVELQFTGPAPELIQPFKIVGKRLTIRPAPNFRPVLRVGIPTEIARSGALRAPKIITLSGASAGLDMYDVDLVLRINRGSLTDRWSIFSLSQAASVVLQSVSVTCENPDRQPAAVFEIASPVSSNTSRTVMTGVPDRSRLSFDWGIVRGPIDLVWHDSNDPATVNVSNSAFALNGSFYRRSAINSVTDAMATRDLENQIQLNHVTGIFQQGLLTVQLGDQGETSPFEVNCRDSIIVVPGANQPLIAMSGHGDIDKYTDLLHWQATDCYYDVQSAFWEIRTHGAQGYTTHPWQFPEWKRYWRSERESLISDQLFQNPGLSFPENYTAVQPRDFALRTSGVANPPLRGAGDRTDAGVDVTSSRLPKTLPEVERAESAVIPSRNMRN